MKLYHIGEPITNSRLQLTIINEDKHGKKKKKEIKKK